MATGAEGTQTAQKRQQTLVSLSPKEWRVGFLHITSTYLGVEKQNGILVLLYKEDGTLF